MHVHVRRVSAALGGLTLAAAACTAGAPEEDSLASLTVGVAAPIIQQSGTPLGINHHRDVLTRETLVALGADGRTSPRVLESWNVSADGLTWRLTIRRGIRFHDGTAVTAGDLAPRLRSGLMAAQLKKIASVDVEGNDAIIIRLHERWAFMPEDLGQATAVRTVVERDDEGKIIRQQSFGTGAYTVAEESVERLLLREFPNHYRGNPGVSEIEVKLFPDQRNAWSALMRDEIDVLYEVSRDSLDFVRSELSINVATFPRAYVYVLGFNSRLPQLRSPAVRQAINRAIDRQAFVNLALSGEGEPATGHVWPQHWAFDPSVAPPAHNAREAARMLAGAGLTLSEAPGRMPARLRIKCLVYEPFKRMALVLQRQLAAADVDLELEVLSGEPYVKRIVSGDYETFLFEMTSGRTVMWPYLFWHSTSPFMQHGYSGADEVLDRMRMATTDDDMRAATSALQRRLLDDPPAAFLAWGRVSRAVTKRFELPAPGIDIYHTIPQWKLAPPRTRGN